MQRLLILVVFVALVGCERPAKLIHGKSVEHWAAALQDPDPQLRRRAVVALGNGGPHDGAVIPALIEALKDRDANVRHEAVLALFKFGPAADEATRARGGET